MEEANKLILVDDNDDQRRLLRRYLVDQHYSIYEASTGQEVLDVARREAPDLILLDVHLPDISGLEVCRRLKTDPVLSDVIVFLISAQKTSPLHQADGLESGADGYMPWPINRVELAARIRAMLRIRLARKELDKEKHQSQLRLKNREIELEAFYENAPVMMCLIDQDSQILHANSRLSEFVGVPKDLLKDRSACGAFGCIHENSDPNAFGNGAHCHGCAIQQTITTTIATGQTQRQIICPCVWTLNGQKTELFLSVSSALIRIDAKPSVLVCFEDVTNRRQLEEQLRQAQKMEAIGQLAGGVAHDFNNILSCTLLNLDLLQRMEHLAPEIRETLRDLEKDAQRAAGLTRKLLVFSRREVMQLKVINLNEVVQDIYRMLCRLLEENIAFHLLKAVKPIWLRADVGMIEQVVLNLAINARDAMPQGGRLVIRIQETFVDKAHTERWPQARTGHFARLCLEDTGCGMDPTVQQHIFEPFFTTKEPGKGTGLGLATVYGIVNRHQGWIEVESAPGAGSSFNIYFPVFESAPQAAEEAEANAPTGGGSETILLVEDEESLRNFASKAIRSYGYRVYEAANGADAMQCWNDHRHEIDLLLTDMVMPEGVSGMKLAEQFGREKAGLKTIVASGYADNRNNNENGGVPGVIRLAKPYGASTLINIIRVCLDQT